MLQFIMEQFRTPVEQRFVDEPIFYLNYKIREAERVKKERRQLSFWLSQRTGVTFYQSLPSYKGKGNSSQEDLRTTEDSVKKFSGRSISEDRMRKYVSTEGHCMSWLRKRSRARLSILLLIIGSLWLGQRIEWLPSRILGPLVLLTIGVWEAFISYMNKRESSPRSDINDERET